MGEQNKPQEGKSLTAGENIKYVFGEWLKSQESISFTADSWNAYCAGFKYHEQETASLREELSRIMELCGVQHVNGKGGALVAISFILKERQELAEWKKSQIDTFRPLLDFGQSKESGLRIGESIVSGAISAWKERNELRKELEEEKSKNREAVSKFDRLQNELHQVKADRENEHADAADDYEDLTNNIQSLEKELEAVKKERDGSVEIRDNSLGYLKICQEELIKVTRQRDEAVDILKEIDEAIDYAGASNMPATIVDISIKKIAPLRFRLSSGETKPANPCIHPEWGTDGGGDYCKKCGFRL